MAKQHPPVASLVDSLKRRDRAIDALATLAWLVDCQTDVPSERLVPLLDILTAELHAARLGIEA